MITKHVLVGVFIVLSLVNHALLQGSGYNGNLRLCVVEGRGTYKRASKYCPVLDRENSGIECVLGTDRLDCLRRINKGTVDFGVFSPEDLVAAQWANVEVLVTNELRSRHKPFERSVVAVILNQILPEHSSSIQEILRNRTLCHPGVGVDGIRGLSDTLTGYLESLLIPRACDPALSLAENKIKALSGFFGRSCKAGTWVDDERRDAELKKRYHTLCDACASQCGRGDQYWGDAGALTCLLEAGQLTWAEGDDVRAYFGLNPHRRTDDIYPDGSQYSYLCRDGSHQPLSTEDPCVWLHRPWHVIVAKRKAAESVAALATSLTNATVAVAKDWRGALAALLEVHQAQPEPLQPPVVPADYLARAKGFREAYSQSGCDPPRHVSLCSTSVLAKYKCEWLSEAGAVYGVAPPLQCAYRPTVEECMESAENGESVVQADSNWLLKGTRDYALAPVLHESTPIVDQTHTVVAYVTETSGITKMADLRGKRAVFPEYDGFAWHAVLRYLTNKTETTCTGVKSYFGEICAPGFEKQANLTEGDRESLVKSCYKFNGTVLSGEMQALQAIVEGKSDVAFISMGTYNLYAANKLTFPWAAKPIRITPVCPEENRKYCFISWSNLGHIFAAKNITAMRRQEIINVFTKLDKLFGKHSSQSTMFSMYGPFNHNMDILFHNNTRNLATDDMLQINPFDRIPLNFERSLSESTESCQTRHFVNFGAKVEPSVLILVSFVIYLFFR